MQCMIQAREDGGFEPGRPIWTKQLTGHDLLPRHARLTALMLSRVAAPPSSRGARRVARSEARKRRASERRYVGSCNELASSCLWDVTFGLGARPQAFASRRWRSNSLIFSTRSSGLFTDSLRSEERRV